MRAYARIVGITADPPPLPVTLVPEASRQALFRTLVAVLPVSD